MNRASLTAGGFRVGSRLIAPGKPCLVIAEVGLAHDGSLGLAHAFIDAVGQAGADAVKFQTHIAEAESTPHEPFRVQGSAQDATRYEYWKRTAFTEAQWRELAQYAAAQGLVFLSSPFSVEAVEMLVRIGMPAWKIASGQVGDLPMLERIAATGQPVLLSTGMSSMSEIDEAVQALRGWGLPYAVFQTTSQYPTTAEAVGLNLLPELRERYRCPVGLSDHSGTIWPGVAAVALGVEIVEVHVVLGRETRGVDVAASLTAQELRLLVEGVRFVERMRMHPVDKDHMAGILRPMREIFTKSVVARMDLPAGTLLVGEHLAVRKPGTGIPPAALPRVIGRRLKRAVRVNDLLQEADLEA